MADHEPVDAATYAAHLDRLDRIGREALAADPAEAIRLVREANDLVAELLPMHRALMDELAHHRDTLQAACDALAGDAGDPEAGDASGAGGAGDVGAAPGDGDATAARAGQADEATSEALDGLTSQDDAPF